MPTRDSFPVLPRTVLGKKVKTLRAQGILPANVYGRSTDSLAVQVDARAFARLIASSTIRGVFDLEVEGEAKPRPVILREVVRKGGTGDPIHADFLQVDADRPVEVVVPLNLVGEAPAVRDLAGTLVHVVTTARVRSLPDDIPAALDVDLGLLTGFSQAVTIGDIKPPKGVTLLNRPDLVIATVSPPRARRA